MRAIRILLIVMVAMISFVTSYGYCQDATTARKADLIAGNSVNTLTGYSVKSLEASSAAAQNLIDNKNAINTAVENITKDIAGIDTSVPGVWTVNGNLVLNEPLNIPEGTTLTIANGGSLTSSSYVNIGGTFNNINLNGSSSLYDSGTISMSQDPITIVGTSLMTTVDNLTINSGNTVIFTGPTTIGGTLTISDGALVISDPNFNPITNNNPGAGITMTGTISTSPLTITGVGSIIGNTGTSQIGIPQQIPQPNNNPGVGATFTSTSTFTPTNKAQGGAQKKLVHGGFEKEKQHLRDIINSDNDTKHNSKG